MRIFASVAVEGGSGSGICARLPAAQAGEEIFASAPEIDARLAALRWQPAHCAGAPELIDALGRLWEDMLREMRERGARGEFRSAAEAVRRVGGELRRALSASSSAYLRERAADILDIERHMLALLGARTAPELPPGSALVIEELTVLAAIEAVRARAAAVLTRAYSPLSHAAIVLRGAGIPVAHGLSNLRVFQDGDRVLVDGLRGRVVLEPEARMIGEMAPPAEAKAPEAVPLADGTLLRIALNCDGSWQFCPEGAEIGLLRTEFFYQSLGRMPDEGELLEEYMKIAAGRPRTTIRLLDAGGDKPVPGLSGTGGARGVRLLLRNPRVLRTQLRAILRAAAASPVRALVPMAAEPRELAAVRAHLRACAGELEAEGLAHGADIPLGAMLETPEAVSLCADFAREADFASIGSNDLMRRAGESGEVVLYWAETCMRSFRSAGKPISLCGEMAADARWIARLVEIGVREISVPPPAAPTIRAAIKDCKNEGMRL